MRTFILILCLLCSGLANAFDWSRLPPPKPIPFTENGVTYDAFVQTRHPWYHQNYTVYYPENIPESLKPVAVDYNQGPPYQHLWILLNPLSQSQAFDSFDYNPNVIIYSCYENQDGKCENDTWGNPVSINQIRYRQYTWFDWTYAGPTGYDLQNDLVRAVGIDIKVNFGYNWDGQFGLPSLAAGDVLVEGGVPFAYLGFPIQINDPNGNPYTAYTAPVSSVMDHSGATPYSDSDHQVVTFTGQSSEIQTPYSGTTCYSKSDNSAFGFGITYVGYVGTNYLCYNGHPGYDYPFSQGTYIVAPEGGTLCVATANTQSYGAGTVWRDPTRCPLAALAGSTTWDTNGHEYHAFYIVHSGLNINGSPADYITGFLHSNNLEGSIQSSIEQHGYATVTKGQFVAQVGGWGTSGANTYGYHMHLEIYKKSVSTSNWDLVDPYGDGTNNILWSH